MASDPRDQLTRKTPPAGVAAQLARPVEVDPETTPIGAPPTERRARASDVEAAQAQILEVQRAAAARVEVWVAEDNRQHAEIRQTITELKGDVGQVRATQNTMNGHLSDLRVETGKQSVSIDALVEDSTMSKQKRTMLEIAKQDIDLKDRADRKIKGRELWVTIAKWGGGLLVAGLTVLVTHLAEQCNRPKALAPVTISVPVARPPDAGAR